MAGLDPVISIGRLAARTGLAVSAIRFYETKGLVAPSRGPGGQRRFRRSDARRLSFVLIAQKFGFTINEIAGMLGRLPEGRTPTEADWSEIGAAIRTNLNQRIETLERMRDNLDGCIGCGCLSLKRCALYNPGDEAARHGPGPRFLMGDQPKGQGGSPQGL